MVPMNCRTTTTMSGLRYAARNLRVSLSSIRLLLSPCPDPLEQEVCDLLGAERGRHSELGAAGPEDEAAQGDGGDLGLHRELVAVLFEDPGQAAVQLRLGVDDELRRTEVLLDVVGPMRLL